MLAKLIQRLSPAAIPVLLVLTAALAPAATLTISPPVIFDCVDGVHGHVTLTWSGASGPVQIRIGAPDGVVMTGFQPPSGSAGTGDWVGDGMVFFLVNEAGGAEADAIARADCNRAQPPPEAGGGQSSYLPLTVGNTWIYRVNSRAVTSAYLLRTVTGTRQAGGRTYFVVTSMLGNGDPQESLLREDADGRIFAFTGDETAAREELLLDPNLLAVQAFATPLASFPETVAPVINTTLLRTNQVWARGVGMIKSETTMMSGSSGGFVESLDLAEVRLRGGIHLSLPAPRISLSTENTRLNVSGGRVANCAIPCYFVACGLGGADPPDTYKPCVQARLEAAANDAFLANLELLNGAGDVVYRFDTASQQPGELLRYVQVPLYTAPNEPLPPGPYRLVGGMRVADAPVAEAAIQLEIE